MTPQMRIGLKTAILALMAQIPLTQAVNANFNCGILQTHCDPARRPEYQFGGLFLPQSGVKWHCRRRNVFDKLSSGFSDLRLKFSSNDRNYDNSHYNRNYTNSHTHRNNDFHYRILILNPLYVFYELSKRNLISYALRDDSVVVRRNSFLHRLLNNAN